MPWLKATVARNRPLIATRNAPSGPLPFSHGRSSPVTLLRWPLQRVDQPLDRGFLATQGDSALSN